MTRRDHIEVVGSRLDVGSETVRASTTLLSKVERERASRVSPDRGLIGAIVAQSSALAAAATGGPEPIVPRFASPPGVALS